jgi:hypothetical protein
MEIPTPAPELKPTPASAWKGKLEIEGTDLELPSGNVARVKQITPQAFLASGMIPDPLSQIIRQGINSKQGLPPAAMSKMTEDPDQIVSALELFDRVLAHVVIEPAVDMPPTCTECGEYANGPVHKGKPDHRYSEGPRDPDVLYADTVDMDDKVFVFGWCLGGTRDLERFREELQGNMESISNGKNIQRKTKRATVRG